MHKADLLWLRHENAKPRESATTPIFTALINSEPYAGTERTLSEKRPGPDDDRKLWWRRFRFGLTYYQGAC